MTKSKKSIFLQRIESNDIQDISKRTLITRGIATAGVIGTSSLLGISALAKTADNPVLTKFLAGHNHTKSNDYLKAKIEADLIDLNGASILTDDDRLSTSDLADNIFNGVIDNFQTFWTWKASAYMKRLNTYMLFAYFASPYPPFNEWDKDYNYYIRPENKAFLRERARIFLERVNAGDQLAINCLDAAKYWSTTTSTVNILPDYPRTYDPIEAQQYQLDFSNASHDNINKIVQGRGYILEIMNLFMYTTSGAVGYQAFRGKCIRAERFDDRRSRRLNSPRFPRKDTAVEVVIPGSSAPNIQIKFGNLRGTTIERVQLKNTENIFYTLVHGPAWDGNSQSLNGEFYRPPLVVTDPSLTQYFNITTNQVQASDATSGNMDTQGIDYYSRADVARFGPISTEIPGWSNDTLIPLAPSMHRILVENTNDGYYAYVLTASLARFLAMGAVANTRLMLYRASPALGKTHYVINLAQLAEAYTAEITTENTIELWRRNLNAAGRIALGANLSIITACGLISFILSNILKNEAEAVVEENKRAGRTTTVEQDKEVVLTRLKWKLSIGNLAAVLSAVGVLVAAGTDPRWKPSAQVAPKAIFLAPTFFGMADLAAATSEFILFAKAPDKTSQSAVLNLMNGVMRGCAASVSIVDVIFKIKNWDIQHKTQIFGYPLVAHTTYYAWVSTGFLGLSAALTAAGY